MKRERGSVTLKAFIGYFLLAIVGGGMIWFIYNQALKINRSVDHRDGNRKLTLISEVATRLYIADGMNRNISQGQSQINSRDFDNAIDTVARLIDSLKVLYREDNTLKDLDSIQVLLVESKKNFRRIAEFKKQREGEDYYDRVRERLAKGDYRSKGVDYRALVEGLEPFQNSMGEDYTKNTDPDGEIKMVSRSADSMVNSMKRALLVMELEEHRYQNNLKAQENELLNNGRKISEQLRKIRAKIEQGEVQRSLEEMDTQQELLRKSSRMITIFGFVSVVIILFFLILIMRDSRKKNRYRRALEKAKSYAERLLKSREQLMAAVTHDLRSPLNSILGYSELMGRTPLDPKQKNYLNQLIKSSGYTTRLVNDLLDFSRLEAGKVIVEDLPFVPKKLIEEVIAINIPFPNPKHLVIDTSFTEEMGASYLSDPFRIKRILANLLGNAYKFTSTGKIQVRGELLAVEGDTVLQVAVEDSGKGIAKEQQEKIFQEFSQADAETEREYGGSGLGLAISRKLAELLGGSLSVESELGVGSTFTLKIPVKVTKAAVAVPERSAISPEQTLEGKRILVVDDDRTQRELIKEIFKRYPLEIIETHDAKKALKILKEKDFDLVLTDIQMPGLDGFGLIKKIRKIKTKGELPVIALSGSSKHEKETYLKKGFTDYLLKPYKLHEILNAVMEAMGGQDFERDGGDRKQEENEPADLYDLTDLYVFSDGEEEFVAEVLQSWQEQFAVMLDQFNDAKDAKDRQKLSFLAHKMLPMLRQMKVVILVAPLEKLEDLKQSKLQEEEVYGLADIVLEKGTILLHEIRARD